MARETIIRLTDDIDGSEAAETVSFGFRGTDYEIDLNSKNAGALEKALSKYLDAGRRVSRARAQGRTGSARRSSSRTDLTAIRIWARDQGYEVSDRGRISADVREAYEAAHG